MGRSEYGTPETPARLFKVNLHQGYDDGGAYWGSTMHESLYCLQTEAVWDPNSKTDFEPSLHFYRARNRQLAYFQALEQFPELRLKVACR